MKRRDYLIKKGLAQAGRGKFSAEGMSALAAAREDGIVFDDDVKVEKPKREAKVEEAKLDPNSYEPKAVRKWAAENGIEVNPKGKIHRDIIVSYLAAVENPEKRQARDEFANEAPRVRHAERYIGDGMSRSKLFKDVCNSCGNSIGWCYEPLGPFAFADDNATMVRLYPATK